MKRLKNIRGLRSLLFTIILISSMAFLSLLYHCRYIGTCNLARTIRLFSRRQHAHYYEPNEPNPNGVCVVYNFTQATKIREAAVFTSSSPNSTYEPITLCVHTTMDRTHYLWEHITHWEDLISVALLVRPGEEECLARLARAWRCYAPFREKVSLHVMWYRGAFQRECHVPNSLLEQIPDEGDEATLCAGLQPEAKYYRQSCGLPFPDLLYHYTRMHNVALRGSSTQLHLVVDIETIFSEHFARRVRQATQRHLMPLPSTSTALDAKEPKKVLIFRRFEAEVDDQEGPPRTIEALGALIKAGKANAFHGHYWPDGHSIPGLEEWLSHALASPNGKVGVTHLNYTRFLPPDDNRNALWEPQFIAHANTPLYYEDTVARYKTRQVMASELCRAGYEFLLLSHVFNVHSGIKTEHSLLDRLIIEIRRDKKKPFHKRFNAFLDERYPKKEECPPV